MTVPLRHAFSFGLISPGLPRKTTDLLNPTNAEHPGFFLEVFDCHEFEDSPGRNREHRHKQSSLYPRTIAIDKMVLVCPQRYRSVIVATVRGPSLSKRRCCRSSTVAYREGRNRKLQIGSEPSLPLFGESILCRSSLPDTALEVPDTKR